MSFFATATLSAERRLMIMVSTSRFRAVSLRMQLAIAFGAIASLLAMLLTLVLGNMVSRETESAEGAALRVVSHNVAHALADDVRKNLRTVEVLAASPTIWADGLSSPSVRAMIARIQAVNPDISWIGVAGIDGRVRAGSGGLLEGADVHERPWFEPGRRGVHVGDVHGAKLLSGLLGPGLHGEPRRFVDFAAPLSSQGRTQGVLVFHGSWDWADTVVSRLLPDDASARHIETFIFDRNRQMIYAQGGHLPAFIAAGQTLPEFAETLPTRVRWMDGNSYLTSAARSPAGLTVGDLGWTVVTREPELVAFGAARRAHRAAFAIGGLAAAGAVLLGWLLAARLSRPLALMSRDARAITEGRAHAIVARGGSLEVADLSGALSAMTGKLVAARRDLEQRVRARTDELSRANAELARLARLDPLTGLANRRAFDERADQLVATARRTGAPLAVAIVDADHFKRVNDIHGHPTGDATLIAIADALRGCLREVDMAARIGGEEFAILLPGADAQGVRFVVDKILHRIRALDIPKVGRVTVSCGAAIVDLTRGGMSEALANADRALYRAKQSGRDRAEIERHPFESQVEQMRVASADLETTLERIQTSLNK